MSDGGGRAAKGKRRPPKEQESAVGPILAIVITVATVWFYLTTSAETQQQVEPWVFGLLAVSVTLQVSGWRFRKVRPKQPPVREVMVTEWVPYPPEYVWSFMKPAENSALVQAGVRGYREPDTPEGLGERQTFVRGEHRATLEVIEYEAGRRAVHVSVVKGRAVLDGPHLIETVDPEGAGSRVGYGERVSPDASPEDGVPFPRATRRHLAKQLAEMMAALERWDGRPPT